MLVSAGVILALLLAVSLAVLRPQRKEHDARALMLGSVRRGDEVYTTDGIHARVEKASGGTVVLACHPGGVRLKASLDAIAQVEGYDAKAQTRKFKESKGIRSRMGRGNRGRKAR